jgi:hypothetical protein
VIPLALLRPFLPVIAVALAASVGYLYHTRAVSTAYAAGEAARQALWTAADNIAVAIGNETTALLKRANAANTGVLHDKLQVLAKRNAAAEYRNCAALLSQGVEVADEGARLVADGEARLTALQDWARLVQSPSEPP